MRLLRNFLLCWATAMLALPCPGQERAEKSPPGPASASVAQTNSMEVLDISRKLNIGDRVSYRVVEDRKPPVALVVTDSGDLEVPLIGRVAARGVTCRTLAYEIKRQLEKEYYYKCTVILGLDAVSTRAQGKVYLSGQVKTQGGMEIQAEEVLTVSRAILRAGGFAEFANKRKVKLVRKKANGQQEILVVDVARILEKGNTAEDVALQPDDVIIVPERFINF